ncbi:uncharacterized protein ACN2A1_009575 [Glossina fuscipes fuscipes]
MESSLLSMQPKEIDHICRTCGFVRAKPGRYSLHDSIPLNTGPPKAYGELLSNLLKNNLAMETANIMPQRLCIKCANLLKNVLIVDMKTEPQPSTNLLNSESVETGVKLEESNAKVKKGGKTKNTDEHSLSDVIVKFEHNGEAKRYWLRNLLFSKL